MDDRERLAGYIDIWWSAIDDLLRLVEALDAELSPADWHRPTDLPGWDVHDVVAHLAHLEAVLAGAPEEPPSAEPPPAHATNPTGVYTEHGVRARRDRTPADLITELRQAAARRQAELAANPPTDAAARPERIFGGLDWDWQTLLQNRPIDVWMHEQDLRRALGRPGNLDSPAARHTIGLLARSLGFVLGKRAGAPAGATLIVEIGDDRPRAFAVSASGRGEPVRELPPDPTVRLRMDATSFAVLAGGRREPEPGAVVIEGDQPLGRRILAAMAVTP
ncbi:MAG: maleylpyruvate isomerase family mycothiol-dependent enzyme [Kineosporiaceae bacterium]|nr:maleylpyruvate isomerase family mycothiol-dependent enzyme [Kineosporiaceae bacterium]